MKRGNRSMNVLEHNVRATNSYYNRGLQLTRQRDLSGAAPYSRRTLGLGKDLTDTKNLLGLISYEMREIGDALMQ